LAKVTKERAIWRPFGANSSPNRVSAGSPQVDRSFGEPGIGLADASLVVLAARAATRSPLTLDERHFRAVRPQQGGAFRLLRLPIAAGRRLMPTGDRHQPIDTNLALGPKHLRRRCQWRDCGFEP